MAIDEMLASKVALKSKVWRSAGKYSIIASSEAWKPISSIRSASSRTSVSILSNDKLFLSRWSKILPGVPTIICAPWASDPFCGPNAEPPHNVRTLTLCIMHPSLRISPATWSASSLVGHKTSAWILNFVASSLFKIPKEKAAVLPEPVTPCPITSYPSRTSGSVFACIGVNLL